MTRDIAAGQEQRVRPGWGRSIIAVIGIDRYPAWPALSNAVNDATGISQLFQQLGFIELTPPLLNGSATREAMWRLVTDDLAKLDSTDSLVLFFAGHGHTRKTYPDGKPTKIGYVVPVDAAEKRAATWVRLDFWLNEVALLPPRHILVIIDACHSGVALDAIVKWRGAASWTTALDDLQARRSRRIITSALDDQRAMDGGPYPGHSLFTGCYAATVADQVEHGVLQFSRENGEVLEFGRIVRASSAVEELMAQPSGVMRHAHGGALGSYAELVDDQLAITEI